MAPETTHQPAIAKPETPGGPYIITCTCGFTAEAHYPTAALVGAYHHDAPHHNDDDGAREGDE